MATEDLSKEEIILRAVKGVLTKVLKDTAVQPGMLHPLEDSTMADIRDCLVLITAREQELAEAAGRPMRMRPRFVDEPKPQGEVVVPLGKIGRRNNDPQG